MRLEQSQKKDFLLGLYIACMLLANLLGTKITSLFGVRVSVGIFFVPVLFLTTDVIGEVYGKREAGRFVALSLFLLVFTLGMTALAIALPANAGWGSQEEYARVFGSSLRMMGASILAYIVSQFHDVWAFDFWKRRTGGRLLWLRNNASTIVSQFIDTTIFMFAAFYGAAPRFTVSFIFELIIPYWLCKVVLALLDTPLCYFLVKWLRSGHSGKI
ncbi:MAG: queuosine precursor transporter [Spirochaetales bacterium]|jgi:uncharacterized integral membrane protein (TIGR00697 family)|nr:queuosine precursor transporter [Spirochaetales bacterium]